MLAITTFDYKKSMIQLLRSKGLELSSGSGFYSLPYPHNYPDRGVSKEVQSHAVLEIAKKITKTEETIILDVPTLFNVIRQLQEEKKELGLIDAFTESRVAFLTYDENYEHPQITSDINEALQREEHIEDMQDVAFVVLEDENKMFSTNDLIMSVKEKNDEDSLKIVESEYGLYLPEFGNEKQIEMRRIPVPLPSEIVGLSKENVWERISGLIKTKQKVYIHKSIWKQCPGLSMLNGKSPNKMVLL